MDIINFIDITSLVSTICRCDIAHYLLLRRISLLCGCGLLLYTE